MLRPGTNCDDAIKFLQNLTTGGLNGVQSAVPHFPYTPFNVSSTSERHAQDAAVGHARRKYDEWTLTASTQLLKLFADRSVAARVRGDRYSYIVHGQFPSDRWAQLIHGEIQELRTYFMELTNDLFAMQERHKNHRVRTLVLDTNDLLHWSRYDTIPWEKAYRPGTVVVIPHVVVDEIDKKSYTVNGNVRKRARAVFSLLEETMTAIETTGEYRTPGGTVIEILRDEPGHVRLPNNDDEIVARASYLQQAIAPTPVTVITGDNGMRARALAWGLKAGKLDAKYSVDQQAKAAETSEGLEEITVTAEAGMASTDAAD